MAETFKHELMDGDLFVARSKGVSEYEAKRSFNTCMTKQEEKQDKEDDLDAQKCLEQLGIMGNPSPVRDGSPNKRISGDLSSRPPTLQNNIGVQFVPSVPGIQATSVNKGNIYVDPIARVGGTVSSNGGDVYIGPGVSVGGRVEGGGSGSRIQIGGIQYK